MRLKESQKNRTHQNLPVVGRYRYKTRSLTGWTAVHCLHIDLRQNETDYASYCLFRKIYTILTWQQRQGHRMYRKSYSLACLTFSDSVSPRRLANSPFISRMSLAWPTEVLTWLADRYSSFSPDLHVITVCKCNIIFNWCDPYRIIDHLAVLVGGNFYMIANTAGVGPLTFTQLQR